MCLSADTENVAYGWWLVVLTLYDVFVVSEDNSNNLQVIVVKLEITTLDGTAPTNARTYPKTDSVKSIGFNIKTKINENRNTYYVVLINWASLDQKTKIK